ncbi:MAG: ATP-binding protein [Pseudomonadota bacterium]
MTNPTLHLLCGKMAAGKSTLAARLAAEHGAVLLSEDQWTATLWPGELTSLDTYRDRSRRLRTVLWPHVTDLLRSGVSVVLDFAANTRGQRAGLRRIVEDAGVPHVLHYLDVPDVVCKARLRARNAEGAHEYAPSEADFEVFTRYFQAPEAGEGFVIRRVMPDGEVDGVSASGDLPGSVSNE